MTAARMAALFAFVLMTIAATAPATADSAVVEYSIGTRGEVRADLPDFVAAVRDAYADPRGWSLGGVVRFKRVASGGDLEVWLVSPDEMTTFSGDCSPVWSCRVGRDVVINDIRFRDGSPFWPGALDDYRILLINHETGHWLGFEHEPCSGAGALAPVMMQQSKGVGICVGNPWPLQGERIAAGRALGVTVSATSLVSADLPHARGFAPLP